MWTDLRYRLRAIFHSRAVEADLDEELRYHFDRQVEQLRAQGLAEAEALRRARFACGPLDQGKEQCRDARGISWVETGIREFRHAARALLRRPGFALAVIGMLALGIGGNVALFSVFNGLFLKPLPVSDSHELLDINTAAPSWNLERTGVNYFDFVNWRTHNRAFSSIGAYSEIQGNAVSHGNPYRVRGIRATHDLAHVLRLQPAIGRWFTAAEDRPRTNRVVLIAHRIWRDQFGQSPAVVGQGVTLDGEGFEIIGVLPAGLRVPIEADFWVPLGVAPVQNQDWYLSVIGRLRPGISAPMALDDLRRVHKAGAGEFATITFPTVTGIRERFFGDMRSYSVIVLAGVGVVLLIACVNIAGLMLVRARNRRHEMGIRAALGASRWQLGREWLAESFLLAGVGGLAGLALGLSGLHLVTTLIPENALPAWVDFGMDWRFAAFAAVVTIASALLFGLIPAIGASRAAIHKEISEGATRTGSAAGRRGLNALVVAEVALAALLLTSASLLGKAFWDLTRITPGFRPENTLVYSLSLPEAQYTNDAEARAFYDLLLEQTRVTPGVREAGLVSYTPLGGHQGNFFRVEGAPPTPPGQNDPVALRVVASPGFLRAMGLTLAEGRDFLPEEGATPAATPVLVNETFARHYWGDAPSAGKRIGYRRRDTQWMPVIGVVRDWKHYGLDRDVRPAVIVPYRSAIRRSMTVVIHTEREPLALARSVRELVRRLDPQLPVFQLTTMEERLERSLWIRRAYSWCLAFFAAVALILAIAGLYGVVSYTVALRSREIGIRLALGASPARIGRQVLSSGAILALVGLAIGVLTSLAVARSLAARIPGIDAANPWIYIGVATVLGTVALAANAWPARRASRLDPVSIMRSE